MYDIPPCKLKKTAKLAKSNRILPSRPYTGNPLRHDMRSDSQGQPGPEESPVERPGSASWAPNRSCADAASCHWLTPVLLIHLFPGFSKNGIYYHQSMVPKCEKNLISPTEFAMRVLLVEQLLSEISQERLSHETAKKKETTSDGLVIFITKIFIYIYIYIHRV